MGRAPCHWSGGNVGGGARSGGIDRVAAACGIDEEALESFYDLFAGTERVLTVYSQGVNRSSVGTDKVKAIINCHLATGRIGRPGMGPFSATGQPNAMGGPEVGGLANQLAAHMRLDDAGRPDTVRRVWNAPNLTTRPGLKAVELFDAVADGLVRAIWIMATNPAASMPRADRVRARPMAQHDPHRRVPSLMAHTPEPTLAIHPTDAARLGMVRDGMARIDTDEGSVTLRADLCHSERCRRAPTRIPASRS